MIQTADNYKNWRKPKTNHFKKNQMKKIFLILVSAAFVVTGGMFLQSCESDSMFINDTREVFLDLDIANLQSLTDNQMLILEEAKNRIDRHVTFDGNRYQLSIRSGREVNISESLFRHFTGLMDRSNSMVKDLNVIPSAVDDRVLYVFDENQPIQMTARLRSGIETASPAGGVSQVQWHWWGAEVWISNRDMQLISVGYGIAGGAIGITASIVGWLFPPAKPVTVPTGGILVGAAVVKNQYWRGLAILNPNGVIVRCNWLAGCNIFNPRSQ